LRQDPDPEDICPVRGYRAPNRDSRAAGVPAGGLALSANAIALIVRRSSIDEGMTTQRLWAEDYSGHSLRPTSAALNDAAGHAIQRQLRHV
jgi:hypothetical protein